MKMKCEELYSSLVVMRCTVIRGICCRRSDGIQFRRRIDPGLEPRADFGLVNTSALTLLHIRLVNGEMWTLI